MPGRHLSAKQTCSITWQDSQAKLATVRVSVDRSPDWQQELATWQYGQQQARLQQKAQHGQQQTSCQHKIIVWSAACCKARFTDRAQPGKPGCNRNTVCWGSTQFSKQKDTAWSAACCKATVNNHAQLSKLSCNRKFSHSVSQQQTSLQAKSDSVFSSHLQT